MVVHGYGADAALDGTVLTLTATGKVGRGALGTDRREIAVDRVKALDFRRGNMARNGRLTLVDERGKSIVHFRRKSNDQMAALYDAISALAPSGATELSTDDAPLFSEDAQAAIAKMSAWLERKHAEAEAKKQAKEERK